MRRGHLSDIKENQFSALELTVEWNTTISADTGGLFLSRRVDDWMPQCPVSVTQLGRREEEINEEEATVIQVGQTVSVQLIKCSSHTGNSGVTWTCNATKSDDNIAEEVQAVRQLLKTKTRDDTQFQLETQYS